MTISEEIQHLYANSSRSLVDDMSFIVDNGYVRSGPGYCRMFVALDTYTLADEWITRYASHAHAHAHAHEHAHAGT